ncbi:hypothetical protein BLNAU_11122 [Blattamonas nauphoetae]|uniref:Exocyst complex component Sec10 n=1 Tax=Blattamonas nauphoetae TaxID=2049346 RepID=A0ABQ9XSD0_9EUKA|nr:hypothetical protein BLNAU_11122 [Blattamonas nauphoetae]
MNPATPILHQLYPESSLSPATVKEFLHSIELDDPRIPSQPHRPQRIDNQLEPPSEQDFSFESVNKAIEKALEQMSSLQAKAKEEPQHVYQSESFGQIRGYLAQAQEILTGLEKGGRDIFRFANSMKSEAKTMEGTIHEKNELIQGTDTLIQLTQRFDGLLESKKNKIQTIKENTAHAEEIFKELYFHPKYVELLLEQEKAAAPGGGIH